MVNFHKYIVLNEHPFLKNEFGIDFFGGNKVNFEGFFPLDLLVFINPTGQGVGGVQF